MFKINNRKIKEINSEYGIKFETDETGVLVMNSGNADNVVLINDIGTDIPSSQSEDTCILSIIDEYEIENITFMFFVPQVSTFSTPQHTVTLFKAIASFEQGQTTMFSTPQHTVTVYPAVENINIDQNTSFEAVNVEITVE